ncbi:protein-disulfide reductase DsbD family protein [Tunturiibacter gelidoferens]|uniref:Thiol:disulfide interchange protein DsbD n=1 Tax=Tunturiibacter gelidiferens TaxID=3069689 RepID=A0ACC5NXB7_9BACT|nr:thioredoxin family protein [Edaphobacter lichenicola]MBB5339232.1 thiol:disulfide interchange protein DsbD [Edaphobacter lichenicola]
MTNVRKLSALLALACALLLQTPAHAQLQVVGDGGPGPVKAQHLTAELVSLSPSIAPGGTVQVGLVLTLEQHWHVYWINAGDSGEPPKITWTLPEGITAGPMLFPIPSRLPLGPLMDFGYEDEVAFPVQLTAADSLKPGPIHLDAKINWLVCREVCIPGRAHLGLNLNVVPGAAPAQPVGAVGEALTLIPKPLPADAKLTITGGKTDFVFNLVTGGRETNAEFYPADQDQIANAAPQQIEPTSDGVRLFVRRSDDLKTLPAQLHGVLKLSDTEAYDVTAPVTSGEVAPIPGSKLPGAPATSSVTTLSAIGLAFIGGIILNLMPCVFPVLFLKGLALVQSSGEERDRLRSHGIVYTLGILVSFWIIVAALLILRATGSQAGWGFQLQSPTFIAVLAAGLFFFALSLAGQFDLGLSLTSVGGGLAQKQGYTGSFFTGVLATIVATPCTAPLMGAAIGFALAQPAGVTFAVFTALGLGLATPYLLLSFQPAWTRILPRPGAWMEILKQLTAVPLFGTAIWLAWVYGNLHSGNSQGVDHLARLLWCFLALAIAGWALGKWPANWKSAIAALLIAALGLAIPLYQPKDTTLVWAPYSQQALDQARAAGHPVFIDFTAAWCLSCQVNERAVLKSADVQHQFSKNKVTLLKADWTQYDPEITKQLASVNRSGVPTYVIYPAMKNSSADVLPELLTKDIVLTALEKDVKP